MGVSMAGIPATVIISNTGGDAGIITSAGAFCDGTSHGAINGDAGGVSLSIPVSYEYPIVDLGNDTTVCVYLDPFILDAGAGFIYEWNDGFHNSNPRSNFQWHILGYGV